MRTILAVVSVLCCTPRPGSGQAKIQPPVTPDADSVTVTAIARQVVSGLGYGVSAPARWNSSTLLRFVGATAVVAGISTADGQGRDAARRNQSDAADAVTSVIEPLGTAPSFGVIAGFAVAGIAFRNTTAASVAADAMASTIIAGGIITPALKLAFGRPRPRANEDPYTFRPFRGDKSFPSGHTTQAFAVASVIASEYDERWVKVTAYGLATGVGISRMYHDAHFASDVAAGALIGTVVGRTIAGHARSVRSPRNTTGTHRIHLYPSFTRDGGAGVVLHFGR